MSHSIAWMTDTHFNLLKPEEFKIFVAQLNSSGFTDLWLTGDISCGTEICFHLSYLAENFPGQIYFILGNHDYYKLFIAESRQMVQKLSQKYSNLHYLTFENQPVPFNEDTALIGDDGWYDGLWREPQTSLIFWWDWYFIKDFRCLFSAEERLTLMQKLAHDALNRIRTNLESALKTHSTIYLLSHIPPWPARHRWKLIENFWKPYNSSKLLASMLMDLMTEHPDKKLIVLSGHTHLKRQEEISHNIELRVGEANFHSPQVQELIEL